MPYSFLPLVPVYDINGKWWVNPLNDISNPQGSLMGQDNKQNRIQALEM
jgi:hypothetical protein